MYPASSVTVMGPAGVGVGVVADVAVAVAEDGAAEDGKTCEYMLSRFGPPQYSVAFPSHVMSHIVAATVNPVARTDPALIVSPQ